MRPSRKSSFSSFSSSSSTVTYTFRNDHTTPPSPSKTQKVKVPLQPPPETPPETTPVPITVHLPPQPQSSASAATAAAKIQSVYRAHVIRKLYKTVSAVNSEANELQSLIQRQDTVDAVRSSEREKVRMNEALMGLLLRLDSVPGIDPTVREARRKVSRRIVGLQEILDAICEAKVEGYGYGYGYGCDDGQSQNGYEWEDGFLRNWNRTLEEMEEEICRERGGEEMERFCAQYLGFRCLQRFLQS